MAKINFNLRSPKAELSPIIIRYRLPRGRVVLSTGVTIPTKYWNERTQMIRRSEEYPAGEKQQHQLNEIESIIKRVEERFFRKGIEPAPEALKAQVEHEMRDERFQDLNSFMKIFIAERDSSPGFRPQSIKVYKTTKNHFLKYIKNRTIYFEDITIELLKGFVDYLQSKNYSDNHVHKMMSTLRTMLNDARDRGLYKSDVHKNKKLWVRRRNSDNIYLTTREIQAIFSLDLSANPGLEVTRDLFIIGCFTGLRFSDYSTLSEENLTTLENGRKAFRIIVYKTGDIVWIPLHPIVEEILLKYDYKLPPGNVNQVMNRQLKDIAEMAKLNEPYQKRIFRSGKAEIITKRRFELVSTHTARRSFASNAYKAKIPMLSIMEITGHKKTETFMKYISLSKKEHAELMLENPFFN